MILCIFSPSVILIYLRDGFMVDAISQEKNDVNNGNDVTSQDITPKLLAAAFGEIVSVLMKSPNHKYLNLADLEWKIAPAILTNQFCVASNKPSEEQKIQTPLGVALWASVSDEIDERLTKDLNRPLKLRPEEWMSGDNKWLIDLIAPQPVASSLFDQLRSTVFAEQNFKMRVIDQSGKPLVKTITPQTQEEELKAESVSENAPSTSGEEPEKKASFLKKFMT